MSRLKQWVALTVVAVVAVLAAGWFLVVSPRHSAAQATRQQAATEQQATALLSTQLAVLQAQAKGLPAEQAKLAAIAAKLPPEAQEPVLIRALTAAATVAGVNLVTIAPGTLSAAPTPVAPAGTTATATTGASGTGAATTTTAASTTTAATSTAATSTGATSTGATSTGATSTGATSTGATSTGATAAAGAAGSLQVLPVTLNISGGYFQIEQYVAALEDLTRAFRVTALTVTPGADPLTPAPPVDPTSITAAPTAQTGNHLLATIVAAVYVNAGATPATPVVAPVVSTTK